MMKYLAIALLFSRVTETDYYERRYNSPSDNKLEEMFLSQFLDEIKPFISPIVDDWNRRAFPDMPGGLLEHLIEKYVPTPRSLSPAAIESFIRQVEELKTCIDQTLARAADHPALRDIQSRFPDSGDMKDDRTQEDPDLGDENTQEDEGYSQKEKLSMFRSLGDNKSVYSKRFRSTEGTPEAAKRADYLGHDTQ